MITNDLDTKRVRVTLFTSFLILVLLIFASLPPLPFSYECSSSMVLCFSFIFKIREGDRERDDRDCFHNDWSLDVLAIQSHSKLLGASLSLHSYSLPAISISKEGRGTSRSEERGGGGSRREERRETVRKMDSEKEGEWVAVYLFITSADSCAA